MAIEATSTESAHGTATRQPGPRRLVLVIVLVALLVGASGVAGWLVSGRFTGAGGKSASLDLRVTNAGVASGTIEFGPGDALTLLRIDDRTFLSGNAGAWRGYGFDEAAATADAGRQLLQPSTLFGVDVPETLRPSELAWHLDPDEDRGQPVTVGTPVTIDGHRSTPISSDTVTTSVSSGRVDRIVNPNFDIRVEPMTLDDVAGYYHDLRPTVSATADATDTESEIGVVAGWSDPCGPVCTSTATLTSTRTPFVTVTIPGVTPGHLPDNLGSGIIDRSQARLLIEPGEPGRSEGARAAGVRDGRRTLGSTHDPNARFTDRPPTVVAANRVSGAGRRR